MTNDIFKTIREIERNRGKQRKNNSGEDKYYALVNKQTGDIIQLSSSNRCYYKGIASLYRAFVRCLDEMNVPIDDIGFKEFKLIECDLTDNDQNELQNFIDNNRNKYSLTLFKRVVAQHNTFNIKFIKENKSVMCRIMCRKSKHYSRFNTALGYYIYDADDYKHEYYFAETMPKLRELLLDEVKKGNIEIPEAGLYVED